MSDTFYAIDPGLAANGGSGWALFAAGTLTACGVLRNRKEWKTIGQRVRGQMELFRAVRGVDLVWIPTVAEHMQQLYKVPAQDLIDLQTLSGKLGDYFVKPSQWKGSVPRHVEQSRSDAALRPWERRLVTECLYETIKGMHKEIWSAVGIGLSVAGRAHRKCGWPEMEVA